MYIRREQQREGIDICNHQVATIHVPEGSKRRSPSIAPGRPPVGRAGTALFPTCSSSPPLLLVPIPRTWPWRLSTNIKTPQVVFVDGVNRIFVLSIDSTFGFWCIYFSGQAVVSSAESWISRFGGTVSGRIRTRRQNSREAAVPLSSCAQRIERRLGTYLDSILSSPSFRNPFLFLYSHTQIQD